MITPPLIQTKLTKVGPTTVVEVKLGMVYRSSVDQFSPATASIDYVKYEEERLKRALWYYIYGDISLELTSLLSKIKDLDFPRETEPSPFLQICDRLTNLIDKLKYDR